MSHSSINEYPWHQSSWDKIVTARSNNHLPHALLLSGAEGIGKLDFAKKLVTSFLCTAPINNKACQNCQSCKTYHSGANPDFLNIELLEGKQQIGVDQIRKLSEFINYTRSFNAYRVVLLNPVERMNQNSANSLLKSLEEPASNTIIILVATHLSRILPTIKSRCQLITLASPSRKQAITWMKAQSPELSNAEECLSMAHGHPVTALKITEEDQSNRQGFAEELLAVCQQQKTITEVAKKWEKFDHSELLNWQITWVQSFIKKQMIPTLDDTAEAHNLSEVLSKLSDTVSEHHQWSLYQQLIMQKQYIHTSVNSLLFIETMLLLWVDTD
jgi:DNA polymerase-3 subunit delta'